MTAKPIITIIISCALLAACGKSTREEKPEPDDNETKIVGKYKDCTIYWTSVNYPGTSITWVRCKKEPKVIETNSTQTCGKGCTRHVKTITTDEVPE